MNPENSLKLIDQLKRHEGFKQTLYKCSKGYLTIGYGHNCEAHGDCDKFTSRTITSTEAENILLSDISEATFSCVKYIKFFSDFSEIQQAVLINMVFNMGIGSLLNFKLMLKNLRLGNKPNTAREMMDSDWFPEVGKRSSELMFMILTEEWL